MKEPRGSQRRAFLVAAGAGVAGVAAGIGAVEWNDAEKANAKMVADLCAAFAARDMARVLPFLSVDCVYRMTETTPPVTGHDGVSARLKSFVESSERVEFRVLETFATGPIVITHRIDRFVSSRPLTWEGVGVFFVKDGKIKEWSDYTIRTER
jgi:limonene-1,2-epoxide hydrolase